MQVEDQTTQREAEDTAQADERVAEPYGRALVQCGSLGGQRGDGGDEQYVERALEFEHPALRGLFQ
jgi:hypothetical protein